MTLSPQRRAERARDWQQRPTAPRKNGEVIVADGYGISVRVNRGHLVVTDGVGRNRRERRYGRATSSISRLVVLGGSGTVSLEAVRWIANVGAGLVCIDRDSRLLLTSTPTKSDASLRRAQALAMHGDAGLEIAKTLLVRKIEGQLSLLRTQLTDHPFALHAVERCLQDADHADTIQGLVVAESEAANAYWGAWAGIETPFAVRERVPEHWRGFDQRTSPLTQSPRLATHPAGAILNYLYSLVEAEARLATLILGLDPALGIIHADISGRDSLPLDLMEPIRPTVDRYLLSLLRGRIFSSDDFHETPRGNCRILPPLTHELAETLPGWRRLVAPIAERVAALLLKPSAGSRPAVTPLTGQNRRVDQARRRTQTEEPRPRKRPPRCKRCGGPVPYKERSFCDSCISLERTNQMDGLHEARRLALARGKPGADPSHGGDAARKRGARNYSHQQAKLDWNRLNPESADPAGFTRDILPGLRGIPLGVLTQATGLSAGYITQIRRGKHVPHPRHWPALQAAAETAG